MHERNEDNTREGPARHVDIVDLDGVRINPFIDMLHAYDSRNDRKKMLY